ncbi:LOW QUALITY PROTEIN: hypothetical protein Cgig2_015906 [Carnegiea gigantea]|uniref:Uncharacterized protein n=1 Tax=Carnegiea gigantea TaxID=171969 RepID=A0A9Q1JK91_9CARY|nr:LOW QUALITY PROTEIN: hypothetical protein Cgig2_015906 [Carnegiea gigantea]
MPTMTDIIIQQVSEQVKKTMEAVRPLRRFEYMPTIGYEPSHRHAPMVSHRHSEGMTEAPHANRNGWSREENRGRSIGADGPHSHRPSHGRPAKLTTTLTPYVTHSLRTTWFEESRPQGLEEKFSNADEPERGVPTVNARKVPLGRGMANAPKPQNARKYCEFYEQKGHTNAECQELRKTLHELADKERPALPSRGVRDCTTLALGGRMLHGDSGHYCRRICRANHSACLEGPSSRGITGSHG